MHLFLRVEVLLEGKAIGVLGQGDECCKFQ